MNERYVSNVWDRLPTVQPTESPVYSVFFESAFSLESLNAESQLDLLEKKVLTKNQIQQRSFENQFGHIHDELEDMVSHNIEKHPNMGNFKKHVTNGDMNDDSNAVVEYYEDFRDELYRIERFVVYRNMLINETQHISKLLNIKFDFLLSMDLDIYTFDINTLFHELYYVPNDIQALCTHGVDWLGFTKDSSAAVNMNGGWIEYGHDSYVNNSFYFYNKQYAQNTRRHFPNAEQRFERVKSCFGGVVLYKSYPGIIESQCKYTLTRDIFYHPFNNAELDLVIDNEEEDDDADVDGHAMVLVDDDSIAPKATVVNEYTYEFWLQSRYHNVYSKQSLVELHTLQSQYIEMLQVMERTLEDKNLYPKDGDICEHIPFHYCLYDHNMPMAVSTRSHLYFIKFWPIKKNDTNWEFLFRK